ncbi:MAG: DUF4373 domain-containing protein [Prevotella sp.]|jgi:hypothetical protein|nr:DUF4373 domain-containing protein [Prevotella sp.]
MKNAGYFFSHDFNARNDEKLISIRLKHGMEGYGVYFAILERLGESSQYIHVIDYNIISYDLRVSNSLVKSIIEDFGLFEFTEDGKHFYSVRFSERMKPLDNMREQRSQAGKKSAEKRKNNRVFNDRSTTVQRPLPKNPTEERRGDKIREDKNKPPIIPPGDVDSFKHAFEEFRKAYPGVKRGLDTEYDNFRKKHKDYRGVVNLLLTAITNQIKWHDEKKNRGEFVPEYANLSTWINQRRWETELVNPSNQANNEPRIC